MKAFPRCIQVFIILRSAAGCRMRRCDSVPDIWIVVCRRSRSFFLDIKAPWSPGKESTAIAHLSKRAVFKMLLCMQEPQNRWWRYDDDDDIMYTWLQFNLISFCLTPSPSPPPCVCVAMWRLIRTMETTSFRLKCRCKNYYGLWRKNVGRKRFQRRDFFLSSASRSAWIASAESGEQKPRTWVPFILSALSFILSRLRGLFSLRRAPYPLAREQWYGSRRVHDSHLIAFCFTFRL